jgi:hypothetical protein
MPEDDAMRALRDELDRQRADQERRHAELVAELRGAPKMSAAGARQSIRDGYAQSEAERQAAKQGNAEQNGGDDE